MLFSYVIANTNQADVGSLMNKHADGELPPTHNRIWHFFQNPRFVLRQKYTMVGGLRPQASIAAGPVARARRAFMAGISAPRNAGTGHPQPPLERTGRLALDVLAPMRSRDFRPEQGAGSRRHAMIGRR